MKGLRLALATLSLFAMALFVARAQEDTNKLRTLEAVMTERRLTVLEDFMAEVRRNAERSQTLQTAIIAGVTGLVLEAIFRVMRSNKKL